MRNAVICLITAGLLNTSAVAGRGQAAPAAIDAGIAAGRYQADPLHTQVMFGIGHLGFNPYFGLFGDIAGSLEIDPARPGEATLAITVPIKSVITSSKSLDGKLLGPAFFDVARHPSATFTSTSTIVSGRDAKVRGNLTLLGVTKPVELAVKLVGAGINPITKAPTIGFEATTRIRRSEFGLTNGVGPIGDEVDLKISAAFERR